MLHLINNQRSGLILLLTSLTSSLGIIWVLWLIGFIQIQYPDLFVGNPFSQIWLFVHRNLGRSIWVFFSVIVIYIYQLEKLNRLCNSFITTEFTSKQEKVTCLSQIFFKDRVLNFLVSTMFLTGVLWTSIGTQSALIIAIQNNLATSGKELLSLLIQGGLLIALSTTIFGGFVGQISKAIKLIYIGPKWDKILIMMSQDDARE